MLCGTFKSRRRHVLDEYKLVRSSVKPRMVSGKEKRMKNRLHKSTSQLFLKDLKDLQTVRNCVYSFSHKLEV